MAEERLRILLSLVASNCLPPHVSGPSDDSFCRALGSGSRSNIEVEDWFARGLRFAGVVIDNVADFCSFAVDVAGDIPVVSIKRWLGSRLSG